MPEVASARDAAIVSCDIVGHSLSDLQHQLYHVAAINDIVARVIGSCGESEVLWASSGDGGHVVFLQDDWSEAGVDLIARLRHWSAEAHVPLRVTAHVGPVTDVRGADGRVQVVGDGINFAGWMLTRASGEGVVVSQEFRDVLRLASMPETEFHDARILRDKGLTRRCLMLMSIGSDHSRWAAPIESGRRELSVALRRGAGWDVLYFAKRILQTNTVDGEATRAIKKIGPLQLTYQTEGAAGSREETNPFFAYLEPALLCEIVQLSGLVERHYNEIICRLGDDGDTMFVILRGEVGVYKREGQDAERKAEPSLTMREGQIVGELAFALGGKRTADVIALSDVALLSFNYDDISARLPMTSGGQSVRNRVRRFMTRRALEYVCHGAPYLIGPERTGPLAARGDQWEAGLELLKDQEDIRLISADRRKLKITANDIKSTDASSNGHGIYILAAGGLRGDIDSAKTVNSDSFPLLWADVPGVLVLPEFEFDTVANPVKVLYIGAEALEHLDLDERDATYRALRRTAASCFCYDAFISYNSLDYSAAVRWADALREKGLQIFVDKPKTGTEFPPMLTKALLDSRAVIALISANVMVRDARENWVLRETAFHRAYYSDNPRVLPVCLPGGRHEQLIPGFAPINVGDDESLAIEQAARALLRLRDGEDDPPYTLQAKNALTLSQTTPTA